MFNFKNAKSDHSFISQHWKKTLTTGLAVILSLNAVNHIDHSKETRFQNSSEQTAHYIMDQNNNYFAQDTQNNPEQDSIHQNIQKSTVYILAYHEQKDGSFSVESGSGTIIQNSATTASNGYNTIITAGHVVGMGGMIESKDGHISYDKINPNFCDTYKCVAFDSSGHALGQLSMLVSPSKSNPTSVEDKITNDVAVMKITPYDGRYQEISGVKLASELSSSMTRASVSKDYQIDKTETMSIGADQGLSGGGVFNQKGELIGAVSFTEYTHTLKMNIHNQENSMALLATHTMPWKLSSHNEKSEVEKTGIKQSNLRVLADSNFTSHDAIALPDHSFFTAIGNKDVLKVMGDAGKDKKIVPQYKDSESISIYGYPKTAPISYQTHIDNTLTLNKKAASLGL